MINSTANRQVKNVIALKKGARARRDAHLYVVEGPRMCAEIPLGQAEAVYISESFAKRPEAKAFAESGNAATVSDDVFRVMADTQNPQGILALVRQASYTIDDLFPGGSDAALILILEHVQDPGNLGTIVRSAEGAGVSGIVMDDKTADIYSPKVIRSTMGSIFRVPFIRTAGLSDDVKYLRSRGVNIFAADVRGAADYDKADYTKSSAFMIGNEAAGLSDEMLALCDERVRIPILGKVESLNAAVAASILAFEAAAQRRDA